MLEPPSRHHSLILIRKFGVYRACRRCQEKSEVFQRIPKFLFGAVVELSVLPKPLRKSSSVRSTCVVVISLTARAPAELFARRRYQASFAMRPRDSSLLLVFG